MNLLADSIQRGGMSAVTGSIGSVLKERVTESFGISHVKATELAASRASRKRRSLSRRAFSAWTRFVISSVIEKHTG